MAVLSLFYEPVPSRSRTGSAALAISGLVHAAAAIVLAGGYGISRPQPKFDRPYRVQLLELQIPAAAARMHQTLIWQPGRASGAQLLHTAHLAKNRAAQTLILPDPPLELRLPKAVPVPFALAWLEAGNHLESLGRVDPGNDLLPAGRSINQQTSTGLPLSGLAELPPKASVISEPPVPLTAAGTLLVPEVSQSADAVTSNASGMANRAGIVEQATEGDLTAKLNATLRDAAAAKSPETPRGGGMGGEEERQPGKSDDPTRLDLPPDGQYPISVLGPSVTTQHPDISSPLTGRIVSTVYLKLGLKKSWALEYCACAAGVKSAALEAPWAYTLFRPDDLQMPPGTQAALVSGALNTSGQLEDLHLLLPPEWAQQVMLLDTLRRWRFRPAARNGVAVAVQVLLVIPREP